jgi:hypothetical protein
VPLRVALSSSQCRLGSQMLPSGFGVGHLALQGPSFWPPTWSSAPFICVFPNRDADSVPPCSHAGCSLRWVWHHLAGWRGSCGLVAMNCRVTHFPPLTCPSILGHGFSFCASVSSSGNVLPTVRAQTRPSFQSLVSSASFPVDLPNCYSFLRN